MARRLPTKARLELNVYQVVQNAIEEGAAHAARQIEEGRLDRAAAQEVIVNEVAMALDGVILWPN